MTEWNCEAVYDDQIRPLMAQIIAICKEHQIPLVAVFQYARSESDGESYCKTLLPCEDGRQSEEMRALNRQADRMERATIVAYTITSR